MLQSRRLLGRVGRPPELLAPPPLRVPRSLRFLQGAGIPDADTNRLFSPPTEPSPEFPKAESRPM